MSGNSTLRASAALAAPDSSSESIFQASDPEFSSFLAPGKSTIRRYPVVQTDGRTVRDRPGGQAGILGPANKSRNPSPLRRCPGIELCAAAQRQRLRIRRRNRFSELLNPNSRVFEFSKPPSNKFPITVNVSPRPRTG